MPPLATAPSAAPSWNARATVVACDGEKHAAARLQRSPHGP